MKHAKQHNIAMKTTALNLADPCLKYMS